MVDYKGEIKEDKICDAHITSRLIMASIVERNIIDIASVDASCVNELMQISAFYVGNSTKRLSANDLARRLIISYEMVK